MSLYFVIRNIFFQITANIWNIGCHLPMVTIDCFVILLTGSQAVRVSRYNPEWYPQRIYGQKYLYIPSRTINENHWRYLWIHIRGKVTVIVEIRIIDQLDRLITVLKFYYPYRFENQIYIDKFQYLW